MQCQEALELLSGHIDGANTPEQEAALKEHLSSCQSCREILKAYVEIDAGIGAFAEEPPASFTESVMQAVRQEPRKAAKSRRFFGRGTAFAAVAAALVLVLGSGAVKLPQLLADAGSAKSADTATAAQMNDTCNMNNAQPPVQAEKSMDGPTQFVDDTALTAADSTDNAVPEEPAVSMAPGNLLQEKSEADSPETTESGAVRADSQKLSREDVMQTDCVVCILYDEAQKQELETAFALEFTPFADGQEGFWAVAPVDTIAELLQTVDQQTQQELQYPAGITDLSQCDGSQLGYVVVLAS